MEKTNEIMSLINQIAEVKDEKREVIKNQEYVQAALLRDREKTLLKNLDELSGVDDFYKKVYDTEKVVKHLEIIVNSTKELGKLRPNFKEIFDDINFDKYLVDLYKQRDEAYEAVVQLRGLVK